MSRIMARQVVTGILAMLILCSGINQKVAWAQFSDTEEESDMEVPEGYVMVEEEILMMFAEAPGEHFRQANELFKARQFTQCAAQIRQGNAYLRLQLARADVQGKRALKEAVSDLEQLAQDVQSGKVKDTSRLERTFARAHHALARHHQIKAQQYQREEARAKTIKALQAVATHLENGCRWSGQQLDAGVRTAVRETKELPGEMAGGIGWTMEKLGACLNKLGTGIDKLGQTVRPARTRTRTGSDPDPFKDDLNTP